MSFVLRVGENEQQKDQSVFATQQNALETFGFVTVVRDGNLYAAFAGFSPIYNSFGKFYAWKTTKITQTIFSGGAFV